MAITWDQARTKLRGDLWKSGSSGLSNDWADRALHASILEIEAITHWLWLENIKYSTALAVAADEIALPSDFSSARSLCFRLTSSQALDPPLELRTLDDVRAMQPASATQTGSPSLYALQGGNIFLDVKAPIGAMFELVYTARTPDDLDTAVAAGDSNQTLQKQQAGVLALAGHYAALNFLRNNDEATRKLAVWQRIQRRLEDIEGEQRSDLHGGCVVPDDSYHTMAWGR